MSKYFEESERYIREYEVKNGLGREYVDQERRRHGSPFRNSYEVDYNKPDWSNQRLRNGNNFHDPPRKNRQSSVPPTIRRLHYNVGAHSQPQQPAANVGNRYPLYLQNPYSGRYIPSSPAPVEKASDSKQSYWPYNTSNERDFHPRSYFDRYEAERPANKGPLLESGQSLFPPTTYPTTQNIYPTSSPTQNQPTNFNQYTSRPGSPQQIVGVGDIINSEIGFTIQLDVKHFKAKDIKVTLHGHTLTISGERVDEDPKTEQTLKRSFSRKYSIPSDILLDSIKAHLTDFGLLLIRVCFENNLEEIAVDQFSDNQASSTSFPALSNLHKFTPHHLGKSSELERDSNTDRDSRGPSQRRRVGNGQRAITESRSAPNSPVQQRRRRADNDWRAAEYPTTTERTFFEKETRTRIHKTRTSSVSSLLPRQQTPQPQALQRFNSQKHIGNGDRLKVDASDSSSIEESLV